MPADEASGRQLRHLSQLALEEDRLKEALDGLKQLNKEGGISNIERRQIVSAWSDPEKPASKKLLLEIAGPASEEAGCSPAVPDEASSTSSAELAAQKTDEHEAGQQSQGDVGAAPESRLLPADTINHPAQDNHNAQEQAPAASSTSKADDYKRRNPIFTAPADFRDIKDKHERRQKREEIISHLMKRRRWSRAEAIDFIQQGGLEAERMQAEQGMPTDSYWDDMIEKGPPEWFAKAIEEAKAKEKEDKQAASATEQGGETGTGGKQLGGPGSAA